MPTQVSVWVCDYCKFEHSTLEDATKCETQPLPPLQFDLGDFIEFESENVRPPQSVAGSAVATAQGTFIKKERHKVIGFLMVRNQQTGAHGLGYITRNPESLVPVERVVFFFPAEYSSDNREVWFSPLDNRYNAGFAEAESLHVKNPELYFQLQTLYLISKSE